MMNLLEDFANLNNPEKLADFKCTEGVIHHTYWKDSSGKMLGCNERHIQTLNLSEIDDVIGLSSYELYPESTAAQIESNDFETLKSTHAKFFIEPADVLSGEDYIAISCKKPIQSQLGKTIGLMGASLVVKKAQYEERYFTYKHFFQQPHIPENKSSLSPRQIECLIRLVQGMTQKEIAISTGLSVKTVEHYLNMIKNKLKCNTRYELITKALSIPEVRRAI